MRISNIASRLRNRSVVSATILALVGAQAGLAQAATASGPSYGPNSRDLVTHTPIKHVIIIIGENWSFDSLFATYVPKSGETVLEPSLGEHRQPGWLAGHELFEGPAVQRHGHLQI